MGDLKPYWGKWIAVRAEEIVASGSSLPKVRGRGDVRPTDLVARSTPRGPIPCPWCDLRDNLQSSPDSSAG